VIDLSIIVVNWNGKELLRRCLASIANHRTQLSLQVVVVDNDSWDGSEEMVKTEFPQFEFIQSGGNIGFGRANNLARPIAKSDLVLFLNPDTELLDHSLSRMVEFLRQHPKVGAVGCKMRYPTGEVHELGLQYFPSAWAEFLMQLFITGKSRRLLQKFLPYADPNQSGFVKKIYGGCLVCRREALDQVGWFDERYFMYAEDVDLCRSLLDRGWGLYYLSTAEIIHVAGGSSRKAPSGFSVLMKCESIAKLISKYDGPIGCFGYRLGTAVASSFRLGAAFVSKLFSAVLRRGSNAQLANSLAKSSMILMWSLGLRRPTIARRPAKV
jgi:GT2 family glycosyltransferase